MTGAADSQAGTITRSYDGLDRLAQEVTAQGTVSYTYFANGLRQTMTVAGQSAVSYTYDNANRLTSIVQGSQTVAFSYDNANCRTRVTLPNGVTINYTYDSASQLTAIAYRKGAATLGDLTYAYDTAGRRISIGGSFARTDLPTAVATTSRNANNQLMQWGAPTLTYDLNGNLVNDGTYTYTWNARNQLIELGVKGVRLTNSIDRFTMGARAGDAAANSFADFSTWHDCRGWMLRGFRNMSSCAGSTGSLASSPKATTLLFWATFGAHRTDGLAPFTRTS